MKLTLSIISFFLIIGGNLFGDEVSVSFTPQEIQELSNLSLKSSLTHFVENEWSKEVWTKRVHRLGMTDLGALLIGGSLIHYAIQNRFPFQKEKESCKKTLRNFAQRIFSGSLGLGTIFLDYRYRLKDSFEDPEEIWWARTYSNKNTSDFEDRKNRIISLHEKVLKRIYPKAEIEILFSMPNLIFEGIPEGAKLESGELLRLSTERDSSGKIIGITWKFSPEIL